MKLVSTLTERVGFLHAVPIGDLFALLLITLLMGPTFLSQAGVEVELPVSNYQVARHVNPMVVTLTEGAPPVAWLEREQVSLEELSARLAERREKSVQAPVVYLKTDRRIPAKYEREVAELVLRSGCRVFLMGRQATGE